ncbi:hypothetical protein [Kitasatospora purpeofusca]|uniref:hypothetical protein n=1 Tax=Kitasatospora purpeofusca TaxID=67352 RepID=UPI002254C07D|nr:hypothetical protein [Kitasatospora purpeofusca]MCX4758717.1 hypothetical protein [Kitasatospora purpeofusca]WSR30849.1 hypothetical protein OG715_07625 [Kitasatospora purpeofusca]
MSELPDDWSPADNPHAIAVSEATWWNATVALTVRRMREQPTQVRGFDSQQIDARTLVTALRNLLTAATLQKAALTELGAAQTPADELDAARRRFEAALPGLKEIRDGLTHFEHWSRGTGLGAQAAARRAGQREREVARDFWSFQFDPTTDSVTMGPFTIQVTAAEAAAELLHGAIYTAALAVDAARASAVHADAAAALATQRITHQPLAGQVQLTRDRLQRVCVALGRQTESPRSRYDLAARVVAALTSAGLSLTSATHPQADDVTDRLAATETLLVRRS